jgi:hypothetical protein
MLSLVPPPAPAESPPPLEGVALEDAARAELCRSINLDVSVTAPTWRQVLFSGRRIKFSVPKPPEASLLLLSRTEAPQGMAQNEVGMEAVKLGEMLQSTKPKGLVPKSLTAVPPLPPSRDVMTTWLRHVFLVTGGPQVLPLLVSAGYLMPSDVETLEGVYPEGMNRERLAAEEAAMAVSHAGERNGQAPELPAWLNDQMMTLMGEPDDAGFYQDLHGDAGGAKSSGTGGGLGGSTSKLAAQTAPDTTRGDLPR